MGGQGDRRQCSRATKKPLRCRYREMLQTRGGWKSNFFSREPKEKPSFGLSTDAWDGRDSLMESAEGHFNAGLFAYQHHAILGTGIGWRRSCPTWARPDFTSSMNMGISERAGACEDILWKKRRVWMSASGSGSSLLDIIPLNSREKRKALAPSCLDDDDSGEFNTWLGKTPALIQYLKIYLGFRSGVRRGVRLKLENMCAHVFNAIFSPHAALKGAWWWCKSFRRKLKPTFFFKRL